MGEIERRREGERGSGEIFLVPRNRSRSRVVGREWRTITRTTNENEGSGSRLGVGEGDGRVDVVAAFAAAADGHEVAGDEFRLVAAEEGGAGGHLVRLGALAQGVQ